MHTENGSARFLLANFSAPELRHLAAELARRGLLQSFVTRYANQDRSWERMLARLPALGDLYTRTLGLRRIPRGIGHSKVVEAGVACDIAAALVDRFGSRGAQGLALSSRLHRRTARSIARTAARFAPSAAVVIAGSGTALPAFEIAAARGLPRVLNYPSAHHDYRRRFFAAAAHRLPEFARLADCDEEMPELSREQLSRECELADLILVGSRFARDSFIAEGLPAARVKAIPYGVDLQNFTPAPVERSAKPFQVTYVGRISSRKGIGYLLHAYQRFQRPDSRLRLVGSIAGNAACLRPYAGLFSHLPHMPQFRLQEVYRDTDVFVFPSLLEGLGLVVLEAMACGCPVIVSANGPCDVVRDGVDGIIVPAEDAAAIEEALNRLYDDRALLRSMAIAARSGAEAHSWMHYAASAADSIARLPGTTAA